MIILIFPAHSAHGNAIVPIRRLLPTYPAICQTGPANGWRASCASPLFCGTSVPNVPYGIKGGRIVGKGIPRFGGTSIKHKELPEKRGRPNGYKL